MEKEIITLLKKHTKLKEIVLEIPPDLSLGDYAFPCFQLSKKLKLRPDEIARKLAKELPRIKEVSVVEPNGPYLNFFLNKKILIERVIKKILKEKDKYGSSKNKGRIMVEFSGPNPFKAFHMGHLRNTVLGESLVRVLKFLGYKVIPVNYLNDTGTHVSKSIWGMENLKLKSKGNKGEWLGELYSIATEKINNDKRKKEVQEIHKKIEDKNPKYVKLWKQGAKDSINYFNEIYKELDVRFDKTYFDSEYIEKGKKIVKTLLEKRIAERNEGAVLIDLEKYKLNKLLVLKKDGTALYITKDFAMAIDRLKSYKLDKLIYVVGSEQKLHFQQLFKILELYGFEEAKKCFHLSYELVRLPEGRMASRKGKIITYSEIQKEMLSKIKKEVSKRHKSWSGKERQKAIGAIFTSAIKFDMLKQGAERVIVFSPDRALEFEGDTGPYVQYTHARICSILRKEKPKNIVVNLESIEEHNLVNKLSLFPDIVEKAGKELKPSIVANYLLELCRNFNEFYHAYSVLGAKEKIKQGRLSLILATKIVIGNGLNLLAIESPESM